MKTQAQKPTEKTTPENSISDKIDAILGQRYDGQSDTLFLKSKILQILSDEGGQDHKTTALKYLQEIDVALYEFLPDTLKRDRDIIRVALKNGISLSMLPANLQDDEEILSLSFDALIEDGKSMLEYSDFLKRGAKYKKLKQRCIQKLQEIYDSKRFHGSPLDKLLFSLYCADIKLYENIQNSGIIFSQGGKTQLEKNFLKSVVTTAEIGEKDDILSQEEKLKQHVQSQLQDMFGKKIIAYKDLYAYLGDEILSFWKQEKSTESPTGEEDSQEENNSKKDVKNESSELLGDDSSTRIGGFSGYSSFHHSGFTTLQDDSGYKMQLASRTLATMNQLSLDNYFRFSKLLQSLQPDFFLEKHTHKIMIATEVDFFAGEGMTDAKTLKFLNSVGKNIGIPELSYQSEENTEKKVGCFENIESAKKHFSDIKSTGVIEGNLICPPADRGDHAIVEIALKLKGAIVPPYWELSLAKWK